MKFKQGDIVLFNNQFRIFEGYIDDNEAMLYDNSHYGLIYVKTSNIKLATLEEKIDFLMKKALNYK